MTKFKKNPKAEQLIAQAAKPGLDKASDEIIVTADRLAPADATDEQLAVAVRRAAARGPITNLPAEDVASYVSAVKARRGQG